MSTQGKTSDHTAAATLRWLDDHADHGVMTTDCKLIIRSWNKWLATGTDLPASRAIGQPLFEVVPSLVARGLDSHYREALLGQSTVLSHTLHKYIIPCARPNGDPMPQNGRIAPLWCICAQLAAGASGASVRRGAA